MKKEQTRFLSDDFLLGGETAKILYNGSAEKLPIIDYHCHLSPREIAENIKYGDLTQAWLNGDHYKWRAMRACGVGEEFITGGASDREKFDAYACCMPQLIGNPLYHWTHLELKKYFGITDVLNKNTAGKIWAEANERLTDLSVRDIMAFSNVEAVCTTDDPSDDLRYHKIIANDKNFRTKTLPAFRPDKALLIESADWKSYLGKLSDAAGIKINSLETLKASLRARMEFFNSYGCRAADHGLTYFPFAVPENGEAEAVFEKAFAGKAPNAEETAAFRTEMLLFCFREYNKKNWVAEIHCGALRNANGRYFRSVGADGGFDIIGGPINVEKLAGFFNYLDNTGALPETIVFSLDPNDNAAVCALSGAFGNKVRQGSAWWFNDTENGMREQLQTYAAFLPLGGFTGFLTDSRSFLSFARHEYFRRIFCGFIGELVDNGEYPRDMRALGELTEKVCYGNAKKLFRL